MTDWYRSDCALALDGNNDILADGEEGVIA